MGTDYMELFHEAINNLRVATGNDNIAIDDKMDKSVCINGIGVCCEIKKTISNANIFSVIDGINNTND